MQTPELSAGSWLIYLSTRRYLVKSKSRNEVKFASNPINQFIKRGKFLARSPSLDMTEEKEAKRCQIQKVNEIKNESN
jgi:hypothetical protein